MIGIFLTRNALRPYETKSVIATWLRVRDSVASIMKQNTTNNIIKTEAKYAVEWL
jgi:hypothetical protein